MKKITYVLVLMVLAVLPMQLHAQDVFYVSPTGDDKNPGTQAAPWSSPNATKWTDGCTVKISGEIYAFEPAAVKAKRVTLEGITSDAAIAALTDEEFADNANINISGFQLFSIGDDTNAATLTIKNLTIKNVRRAELNVSGGMIFVDIMGILNIENSVLKNFESTKQSFGGAVHCVGKIHAKNTTFDNNSCMYGGAVQIQESEEPVEGTFENCIFTNNKADVYKDPSGNPTTYSQGGAVSLQAIKRGNFIFNKCYFKSNQSKKDVGGAMLLSLVSNADINVSLKVTNSTFTDNYSFGAGGAIAFKNNPTSGKLDFTIANCTFYKNTSSTSTGVAISTSKMGGPNSKVEVTGTHILANNTFFLNTKDAKSGYSANFLYGQRGSDLVLVNNVFLEETWSGSQGITVEPGQQAAGDLKEAIYDYKSYTVKNNVFGRIGGSYYTYWVKGVIPEARNLENQNRELSDAVNGIGWSVSPEQKAVTLGIDTLLTKPTDGGIPYLAIINKDGLAVDYGTSSLLVGGTNIVPLTDVTGSVIYGAFRDAGAYEFRGATGIETISQKSVYVYPTLFSNDLYLSENTASVKLYNISGVCCLTASNVSRVNSSGLASGLYIVKITDKAGKVFIEKVQKQ